MKKFLLTLIIGIITIGCLVACGGTGDMIFENETNESKPVDTESKKPDTEESKNDSDNVPVDHEKDDKKTVVSFVGAGDVLIHGAIYREAEVIASNKQNYSGDYYFKDMYKGISSLVANADIAFANHEAPIANTVISGYPNFNAPSESGDALVDLGFNVINIANNHMFDVDYKTTGYEDTIKYWDTKDALYVGGYKSQADYDKIRILDVKGVKIAFLGYTYDPTSSNGTSMNSASKNNGYILPVLNENAIKKHMAKAKSEADIVIVSVHWGVENSFTPNDTQKQYAKILADNGADVILGHHSHTLHPVEWITSANGNKTLCAYSLGNLISGMLSSKNMVGGFITFDIVKENGQAKIENPMFKPTVCHYNINDFSQKDVEGNPVRTGFQLYMMEDYTEELAKKHGVQNYGSFTLNTLKGYVTNTINQEFLPAYLK